MLNADWKTARFRELPGGLRYVSAWTGGQHVRVRGVDGAGKRVDQEEDQPVTKRLDITPLANYQFPPDSFYGNNLLETARNEKATIKVG